MDLGWPEVLLVLAIVLIVFGAGKLPQVASQLGKGIREFRKASSSDYREDDKSAKEITSGANAKVIVQAAPGDGKAVTTSTTAPPQS